MKLNINKINVMIFIILNITYCTKDLSNVTYTSLPVLSSLFNQRMLLIFKGTYATDNTLEFTEINGNAIYRDTEGVGGDPTFDTTGLPALSNLPIFMDIGELRIASKYQPLGLEALESVRDSARFWDFVAPERQVYCSIPYTLFTNTCENNGGLVKFSEFMTSRGAQYPSNDPTAELRGYSGTQYYHAGVYLRSFITGFAIESGIQKTNTRFDNRLVVGSNIVPRNSYKPGASDIDKQNKTPLMYPVFYNVGGGHADMTINPGYEPYILEMRINIKENLMVHSWVNYTGNVQTMVGFSDWRFNHIGEVDMGGGLLLRPRIIYPETSSNLTITGGTANLKYYYAIYREGETDFTSHLPLIASPVRGPSVFIKYIHSGSYRLRCLNDASPVDGFPETVIREIVFEVKDKPKQSVSVDLTCP